MLNVIKEKLDLSPDLRKKINWASKYTSTFIILEKGALIKLEPTKTLHKLKINNFTFLFFNGIESFYVNNLKERQSLSELEEYFKLVKSCQILFHNK